MDIFTALQTAVSGLKAQSYAISNISGNIANSQTTGYKRIDTSFVDLMAERGSKQEVAGTVIAQSQLTNTLAGNTISTGIPTNIALNGAGFFVVQSQQISGSTAGTNLFTRRGDFALDKNGYLVNGAGGILQNISVDKSSGAVTSNGPIQIKNATAATTTSSISYGANLPTTPGATTSSSSAALLYAPTVAAGATSPVLLADGTAGKIDADTANDTTPDAATFMSNSIVGPTLTVYNSDGDAVPVQMRWAKVQNADAATNKQDTWNLFYANKSGVDGASTSWTNVGKAFQFDATGKLTPALASFDITGMNIDSTTFATMKVDLGAGLSQTGTTGAVSDASLSQNGSAAGTLTDINISTDGKIIGTYSNGLTQQVASVPIVKFTNPDGLKPQSGGAYTYSPDAGAASSDLSGTQIVGGNIEQSNTDIADEFSKMIVTQQAYSANTRVMSTAQQMMSDLLNVIR